MKKTIIALTIMLAAGLTAALNNLDAATVEAGKKLVAPSQELVINGKKPARFSHSKHTALGLDCGVCHHDTKHQPLKEKAIAALPDINGLRCLTCHSATFANDKLQKPMDVFHARCKTCHAAGVKGKKGPSACTACHTSVAAPEQKAAPAEAAAPVTKKIKAVEGC